MKKISRLSFGLFLLAATGVLTSCSHIYSDSSPQTKAIGENSVFTVDKKPGFVDIENKDSKKDNEVVDELQLKTQADYHFSLGETYSYEGLVQKAIEEFKTTLVYDPSSTSVKLRLALEYVKIGLVSEAVKYSEEVIKEDKKNIEAKLLLGGLYSTLKLYDKAVTEYEEVIKIDPSSSAEANLYLGAIYAEKNNLKKAEEYFSKVTKIKEDKFRHLAFYYLGRIYVYGSKVKQAKKAFENSLKAKPDFLDSLLALGTVLEEENQSAKAIKLYASYQDQHGPDANVAKSLSQLYLEKENYDKAYKQYEIIIAAEPSNLSVKIRMALIDIERKEYKTAIKKLKEILFVAPESDKVRFYLAAVYEQLDQPQDAIDQFTKISADSQFYGESVVHAAYLHRQLKRIDSAITLVKEAMKLKTDNPQFYALYASLLDEKKSFVEAEGVLKAGVVKFPENEQLHFFLGSTQDKLGKKQDTITNMKKVLSINPDHLQALNYLAYTYAELGTELVTAEELARKALKLKPNDAYIIDTLGWVLFKKSKFKDAVKYLESAYNMNPSESVIAEHLGDAYYQFQLFSKAKDMYERAARNERNEENVRKLHNKIEQIQQMLTDNQRIPASSL